MTGALHYLKLQLSPSLSSSLVSIKLANPGSPGKMAVKTERVLSMVSTHADLTKISSIKIKV